MRRIVPFVALVGVGMLILRSRMSQVRETAIRHCEGMFERMPDTFPPKKMLRGIEELQVTTARIRELLEARASEAGGPQAEEAVHDAA